MMRSRSAECRSAYSGRRDRTGSSRFRHQMPVEGDADKNPDDALCDRLEVMFSARVVRRVRKRLTPMIFGPPLVGPGKISLVDQNAVTGGHDTVRIALLPTFEARPDTANQRRIEALLFRRRGCPSIANIGRHAAVGR